MEWMSLILIVVGLALFEAVSGVDNAVINAEVLSTMGKKARRFFLTWGMFFAVFAVRGVLPWFIVYATIPELGPWGALTATFSNDPSVTQAIQQSAPILLIGGGIFLLFLFFHWLFLEPKKYGMRGECFFWRQGVWFYASVSFFLCLIIWMALEENPLLALGAVIGSTGFFIVHGFREQAKAGGKRLLSSHLSDVSKVLYLEAIDTSFSIDGVLGAFAFTLSVPLILFGNGLGAVLVRQMTIANIARIQKYAYLKNGAMYSLFVLSLVMILHGFHVPIPEWFSPLITIGIVGYFFDKSRRSLKRGLTPEILG